MLPAPVTDCYVPITSSAIPLSNERTVKLQQQHCHKQTTRTRRFCVQGQVLATSLFQWRATFSTVYTIYLLGHIGVSKCYNIAYTAIEFTKGNSMQYETRVGRQAEFGFEWEYFPPPWIQDDLVSSVIPIKILMCKNDRTSPVLTTWIYNLYIS